MKKLSDRVLVLNKNWTPVATHTVRKALILLYSGGARVVCPDTFETYDFDSWVTKSNSRSPEKDDIWAPQFRIQKPELLLLSDFGGVQRRRVRLSRKNLCKRDNYTCQYCLKPITPDLISIDHVIPRARGGRTTWDNCVIACTKCNVRKGHRAPHEVGMKLARTPIRPNWSPLDEIDGPTPESWKKFLTK